MIYTLFVWTVVATQADGYAAYQKTIHDWRPIAVIESANSRETNANMVAKCTGIAHELNISRERYRCIRTK